MSTFNLITASVFIASIALEAYLNAKENLSHYEKKDSFVNITIALIGVVVNLFVKGMMLSFFLLAEPFAVFHAGNSIVAWIGLFLLVDLQYYLFHWLGHKSRFFWAMHVIHHSSHKFNLTTAIRTPFTNSVFRFAAMTPLVLLGFSPFMVIWMDSLIVSFTFFQHTEMIKKLGWLEYIFSTPSHHRVHHASNPKYIDRNFGGVLILWDKLFGTFQAEEDDEPCVYGLTKPLKKTSVIYVLFHEWRDIINDLYKAKGNHWIGYLFARPGWKPNLSADQTKIHQGFFNLVSAKGIAIIILLLSLTISMVKAQPAEDWIHEGIAAEKKFDDYAAFGFYMKAVQANRQHAEAYWRASRMLSNLAGRSTDKKVKQQKAEESNSLAIRAVQLNSKSKEARLCHIISLGLLSEVADSPSEKLRNAKIIYAEAEAILALDSLNAPAYYVLGKWHLELSKLSWAEKLACNLLFGGVPKGASFDKSIFYFEKAILLQPDYILFHYGKATALYHTGKHQKVITVLEKALQLSPVEPDDKLRKEKCIRLLNESRQLNVKA